MRSVLVRTLGAVVVLFLGSTQAQALQLGIDGGRISLRLELDVHARRGRARAGVQHAGERTQALRHQPRAALVRQPFDVEIDMHVALLELETRGLRQGLDLRH